MTDFRALCARMADELDHYRQLLMDDRRETHALAIEARAALAEQPVGAAMTNLSPAAQAVLDALRAARRSKPPSLKEQALEALEDDDIDVYLIRRALEALPE